MSYCCDHLKDRLTQTCSMHDKYECPDILLDQHSDGVVGILIHDGGTSMVCISYCPWCGAKLKDNDGGRRIDVGDDEDDEVPIDGRH